MSIEKLRLVAGYRLWVADLMREVEIADNFTLGDLCQIIRDCGDLDLETFSALIHCLLAPFLAECLQPRPPAADPETASLSAIRLHWLCEYNSPSETRSPPTTSLRLEVYGINDTREEYELDGQQREEGKQVLQCTRYGLEMTPLFELQHLPLQIAPSMAIVCTEDLGKMPLEIPAPGVTLLQLIYALFWEFSFLGMPTERDARRAKFAEQIRQIEAGEAELIPLEDL